jgi:hypothetical protein
MLDCFDLPRRGEDDDVVRPVKALGRLPKAARAPVVRLCAALAKRATILHNREEDVQATRSPIAKSRSAPKLGPQKASL